MAVKCEGMPLPMEKASFRALYHRFVFLERCAEVEKALGDQLGPEDDGVITYGYFDERRGVAFFPLTAAKRDGSFVEPGKEVEAKPDCLVRAAMGQVRFVPLAESGSELDRLQDRVGLLRGRYEMKDETRMRLRAIREMDDCRVPNYPDHITVLLVRPGQMPEEVYARPDYLGSGQVWGQVLNEPKRAMGIHVGSRIQIRWFRKKNGQYQCISVLTN